MNAPTTLLHRVAGSESDLLALSTYWSWEYLVRKQLARVVAGEAIDILFQPIIDLQDENRAQVAYEALARFPTARQIPVALWFRLANDLNLGIDLESLCARKAVESVGQSNPKPLIFVNSSLDACVQLAIATATQMPAFALDVPCMAVLDDRAPRLLERAREAGAKISIDDTPLEDLHRLREVIVKLRPDFVKVDVLPGLTDSLMGRFNLADASIWCQNEGIRLIAERVEDPQDLPLLQQLGVDWAQGYSLADPSSFPPDR